MKTLIKTTLISLICLAAYAGCYTCGGRGNVIKDCYSCGGSGYFYGGMRCYICKGRGFIIERCYSCCW